MKNIVFMTCFENALDFLDYKEWCFKTWTYWCKKHNVELFILQDEVQPKGDGTYNMPGMKPTWQRWHVFDILDANQIEYDQVALVDIDTMIHWECPNFFEETGGEFSAVKDKFVIEWSHNSIKGYQDFFPEVKFDWTTYFNCGFVVMSKKHKEFCKTVTDFYYNNEDELRKRQHVTVKKGSDQTPINYLIRKSEYKLNFLNDKYNLSQLHQRGVMNQLMVETGYIWHFNGFDKATRNNLMQQVWNLIEKNYENKE